MRVQPIAASQNRRIVAGLGTDEKLPIGRGRRLIGENLLQDRGCELAAAAAAMGKARELHDRRIHDWISPPAPDRRR